MDRCPGFLFGFLLLSLVACGGEEGNTQGPINGSDVRDAHVETALPDGILPDAMSDPVPAICRCGDGLCEPARCGEGWTEGKWTCAADCAVCGNGVCDPGEGIAGPDACPADCCGTCGDGHCRGGECEESPATCPQDCEVACGNGLCEDDENAVGCPQDCDRFVCGNGTCDPDEDAAGCPKDCKAGCGDCTCSASEDYESCPVDCGSCGDGYCVNQCPHLLSETEDTCAVDCGTALPEGVVEGTEVKDAGGEEPASPRGYLEFVTTVGDDGTTCVDKEQCTFNVHVNEERVLKARYIEYDAPLANAAILYEVVDDPQGAGKMLIGTVYTDENGVASDTVKVVEPIATTFKVKISVYNRPDVVPIYFVIIAVPQVSSYLTVTFSYTGTHSFDGVIVYLFKSGTTTAADVPCSDIDPSSIPTADVMTGPIQLSQSAKFPILPGLDEEHEQFYTICTTGVKMDYTLVAYGCNDIDGLVSLYSERHVSIMLNDVGPP